MITLILIRHGLTDWNEAGKLSGSMDTAVLGKEGKKQALAVAEKLKGFDVDVIYCSNLKRAKQTAHIIAKKLGKNVHIEQTLGERNWGIYEGTDWDSLRNKLDNMTLEERFDFKPDGGESWKDFETRLLTTLEKIIEKHEGKTVLVVTHGGVIRALVPILKKFPREESFKERIENTALNVFRMQEGVAEEILLNDISHLEQE